MATYRGVVRGNTIVLEEPADLPEGTKVEVRPVPVTLTPEEEREREKAFLRRLLEIGMISRIPSRAPDPPWLDRTPIEILDGPPVSQTIIDERR